MSDADFDTFLRQRLEQAPIAGAEFVGAIQSRMASDRRRRRLLLWSVSGMSSALVAGWLDLPGSGPEIPSRIPTLDAIALLVLLTGCALTWIGTALQYGRHER